jgi:fermentation-respiration switch protein FrsA (DUF1100 family)
VADLSALKTLLVAAGLAYVSLAAFAYFAADRMIFLPPASSYSGGQLPVTLVPAEDGARIAVLHLPNPGGRFTILYGHGNAEDLGHLAPMLRELRDAGFSVLGYDYRGYGASTGGPPSAKGAYRDLAAVYRHATDDLGIPPGRIVLYGRSVGAGPATELAAREPVAGLVIESGFTSAFRVVTRVPLLPFDRFPNLRNVRRVRCPVLVIHGTDDDVIPFSHGEQLYEAAAEPKRRLWVRGAGHNDLVWVARDAYWTALHEFEALLGSHAPE